jgi:hypothetical protein
MDVHDDGQCPENPNLLTMKTVLDPIASPGTEKAEHVEIN